MDSRETERRQQECDLNNALYHMSDADIVSWLASRPTEKERLRVCGILADEDEAKDEVIQSQVKA